MLEQILGSTTKVNLARVLVSNPERAFSGNELADLAGCSPSSVSEQISSLEGVVAVRDDRGRFRALGDSPLYEPLRRMFAWESSRLAEGGLFDRLERAGGYFVSGSAALILRGLTRDFTVSPRTFLIVCDRRVSKLSGSLILAYPKYSLLFVEDRIDAADYDDLDIVFEDRRTTANVALLERAVVDSLWRIAEERDSVLEAVYALVENPSDTALMKKYARSHGVATESRLAWLLGLINEASRMKRFDVSGLRYDSEKLGLSRRLRVEMEGGVARVLGS